MRPDYFVRLRATGALVSLLTLGLPAWADSPQPSISMYGRPALPPDFVSLPYVNPDAPKGGRFVIGMNGSFDSLNPYIIAGKAPDKITPLTVETLMGRSLDEPFSLYGLLAESITTDEARS